MCVCFLLRAWCCPARFFSIYARTPPAACLVLPCTFDKATEEQKKNCTFTFSNVQYHIFEPILCSWFALYSKLSCFSGRTETLMA
jgi:hypothetical protein